jgi:hypothetical protein
VCGNVGGEQVDQSGCQEDRALAAVLRGSDLDGAAAGALHLAGDGEPAAEEVDVVDLDSGCLSEPQTGERAERDERAEDLLGGLENGT